MKRKDFIRHSALAGLSLSLISNFRRGDENCDATPGETEGPFPTHQPSSLLSKNITAGRAGLPLIIRISIHNINAKCAGLKDALVDIWHCDSKGEYSEYGGKDEHGHQGSPGMPPPGPDSLHHPGGKMRPPPMGGMGSMQATDYTKKHFLRGRQTTDGNGAGVLSIDLSWLVPKPGTAYSRARL